MAIRFLVILGFLTQQWIALPCSAVMKAGNESCSDAGSGTTCCCGMEVELTCCDPQTPAPVQPTQASIDWKSAPALSTSFHVTLPVAAFIATEGHQPVTPLPTLTAPQRCARLCMWVE